MIQYNCMPKTVNPVWYILDVCHNRLIWVRQYGRKKKTFLLCILAKNLENLKFLEIPKEAVFKISSHSVHRGTRQY